MEDAYTQIGRLPDNDFGQSLELWILNDKGWNGMEETPGLFNRKRAGLSVPSIGSCKILKLLSKASPSADSALSPSPVAKKDKTSEGDASAKVAVT